MPTSTFVKVSRVLSGSVLFAASSCSEPNVDSSTTDTETGRSDSSTATTSSAVSSSSTTTAITTQSNASVAPTSSGTTSSASGGTAQSTSSSNSQSGSETSGSNTSALTGASGSSDSNSSASTDSATSSSASGSSATDSSTSATATSADDTSSEPTELSPADLAGEMDGLLYRGECASSDAADECYPGGCVDNVFESIKKVSLGGDENKTYALGLHVYGVVEVRKGYTGGVRRQGTTGNEQSMKDFWYEGGDFEPGNYNVYSLRVTPAVPGVANAVDNGNSYFLNARDGSNEGHEVWELNYTAEILARGGSELTFRAYDQNCTQIQNVGSGARPARGTGPGGALVVTGLDAAEPAPSDFEQPLSTNGLNGQWLYIDVTSVSEVPAN